jgi:hypothetical protein
MGGVRMAVYALLLLAALVLVDWRFQSSVDAGSQDAELVYCLQPAHQGNLVNAAVSLGLAGPGSTASQMRIRGQRLTLAAWRTEDNHAFQRACDALATPAMPAQPSDTGTGTPAILSILLPVIAGSLLALAADDIKQASDRRWVQADELRADWKAFAQAVTSYGEDQVKRLEGIPLSAQVDESRQNLVATLRKIQSQHRKSPTIRTLQDRLAVGGDLGSGITSGWEPGDDEASEKKRSGRAEQIKGHLGQAESSLLKIAGALERRVWLSSRL